MGGLDPPMSYPRLVISVLLLLLGFAGGLIHAAPRTAEVSDGSRQLRTADPLDARVSPPDPARSEAARATATVPGRPLSRAAERQYIESIDPGDWLARFGDVEKRPLH